MTIQAHCPHHGFYILNDKQLDSMKNELGPRSCFLRRWSESLQERIPCNEEIMLFHIDGRKVINSLELK